MLKLIGLLQYQLLAQFSQFLSAHAIGKGGLGFDSRADQFVHCHQRLATAAMFFRICVAQALSPGDEPRQSLHAS